ncbi:hypothetical protein AKO1_008080, partial [Acrasis kona]
MCMIYQDACGIVDIRYGVETLQTDSINYEHALNTEAARLSEHLIMNQCPSEKCEEICKYLLETEFNPLAPPPLAISLPNQQTSDPILYSFLASSSSRDIISNQCDLIRDLSSTIVGNRAAYLEQVLSSIEHYPIHLLDNNDLPTPPLHPITTQQAIRELFKDQTIHDTISSQIKQHLITCGQQYGNMMRALSTQSKSNQHIIYSQFITNHTIKQS